jgi:hypothetical protein
MDDPDQISDLEVALIIGARRSPLEETSDPALEGFDYDHLPAAARMVAREYARLASVIVLSMSRCPQRTATLALLKSSRQEALEWLDLTGRGGRHAH